MDYRHFIYSEFRCKCCGENLMKHETILRLDAAREYAGVPFKINSGYRCFDHNQEVGGSETSSHRWGHAVDIAAPTAYDRFQIVQGLIKAGFNRIGIGSTFVHADDDPEKPNFVMWTY